MSFLVSEASSRLQKNSLVKISGLIDWESLRSQLGDLGRSGYGPEGYDPLKMLKALVLQAWHHLSDPSLEEALRVRLDFMVITGLTEVPDETTICRFRNLLIKQGLLDKLLASINDQLEHKGFKVKASQGAILDATVISSAARPRRELEATPVDRFEEETVYEVKGKESCSKDPDATWLKKGKRSYFGYKGFMTTDKEDGFITHVHVTPAHASEVKELGRILPKLNLKGRLYADKGYASKENKDLLKQSKVKNGIMEKAKKNKPLSSCQKRFNRLISKVRYKVEQGFGTLKRKFKFDRASYQTTPKVHAQMVLKAVAFNLLKALNRLCKPPSIPSLCPK
jgi:IS5 family transposase